MIGSGLDVEACTALPLRSVSFTSVQDGIYALGKKHNLTYYALHLVYQTYCTLPLKQFQYSSDGRWPSVVLSRKIVESFLFRRLSPPGDRWCDVLGFVPAGCLVLLKTSDLPRRKQIVMVAFPASLSTRSFPFTQACPGQYTHRRFGREEKGKRLDCP